MTTSKQYDNLNWLSQISSAPSASSAVSFNYACNSANQRIAITNADNSYWVYQYDRLGQVTSERGRFSVLLTPVSLRHRLTVGAIVRGKEDQKRNRTILRTDLFPA